MLALLRNRSVPDEWDRCHAAQIKLQDGLYGWIYNIDSESADVAVQWRHRTLSTADSIKIVSTGFIDVSPSALANIAGATVSGKRVRIRRHNDREVITTIVVPGEFITLAVAARNVAPISDAATTATAAKRDRRNRIEIPIPSIAGRVVKGCIAVDQIDVKTVEVGAYETLSNTGLSERVPGASSVTLTELLPNRICYEATARQINVNRDSTLGISIEFDQQN